MRQYPTTGVKIPAFRDEREWASNMHACKVVVDGYECNSSEQAFVLGKCVDPADIAKVLLARDGREAKRIGKTVRCREDWDFVQVGHMLKVLRAKFGQNLYLQELLLATGDEELIEYNTWRDRFWGVWEGLGENTLGKLLMRVRAEIKQARSQVESARSWIE